MTQPLALFSSDSTLESTTRHTPQAHLSSLERKSITLKTNGGDYECVVDFIAEVDFDPFKFYAPSPPRTIKKEKKITFFVISQSNPMPIG